MTRFKLVLPRCFRLMFNRMYMLALIAGGVNMFAAAATYQWLVNGEPIAGETGILPVALSPSSLKTEAM